MEKHKIEIASEFNPNLGGRSIKLGPHSGEDFYNKLLLPKFSDAVRENEKLFIYLDGTTGYGSSFLDQSFGELYRKFDKKLVKNTIVFQTKIFQWIVDYINNDIWGKS